MLSELQWHPMAEGGVMYSPEEDAIGTAQSCHDSRELKNTGRLDKTLLYWAPAPDILIQQVWGEAHSFAFLTIPR
jgi:hypothetical protein